MNIEKLLHDEIVDEFKELKNMEVGSEQYKSGIDGTAKLLDRAIEFKRLEIERKEKVENRENETNLKLQQMDEERKDRLVKNCLTGLSIVTGIGLTVWGTLASFKFEETGTVTTIMGRGFINKLLPKK